MDNSIIAHKIKVLVDQKGLSMTKVLAELDIRQGLIYDLEKRGKNPKSETLLKLADYLGCSVDYLLGRTDNPEVNR